tara:strand:- start:2769 stop:3377 length:609 start_codon:yes stop_codon:yes gene_type:complete
MIVIESLKKGIENNERNIDIARKIFLSYQSHAFKNSQDIEYEIKNSIKNHLKVPFLSVQVTGSAKTGFSFFKHTLFTQGKSDLDISIISLELYNRFLEIAHEQTKAFTDLSVFPIYRGQTTDKQFIKNLKKGFINPFFMPDSKEKTEWLDFFRHLSNEHYLMFKKINGGIYSSEYFFECKQAECIELFQEDTEQYDSLPSKI